MKIRQGHKKLILWLVALLTFSFSVTSFADNINFIYDDLNRLIRMVDDRGNVIEYAYDEVGNRTQKNVLLESVAPTTTASPVGGTFGNAQTVTLTCSDGSGGSGCDRIYYTTDGRTPTTASPVYAAPINIAATTTLKYFAKDKAGNSEAIKTQVYTINTAAPAGTIGINSGAVATNSVNVTLNLGCLNAQGCSQMQFSNDNVAYAAAETFNATKAWTLTAGDGSKTVYVKYKDNSGNWSVSYSASIIYDSLAPTTVAAPAGGAYSSARTVTMTCNDGLGSGCDKIYYTTDGSTPTTASPVYTSPISITATTTLKHFAIDKAGNSEAVKTQSYTIDATVPTGTISINSGAVVTNSANVTLTLTCNDPQGCSQMQFSNDNVTYSKAEVFNAAKAWTLAAGDGSKTVYVKFRDNNGNWSTACSAAIVLDTAVPVTTATPAGGTYSGTQTVTLTCSDGTGSGCDKIYYTTDGSTPTTSSPVYTSPLTISNTTMLMFFARDKAGSSEAVKVQSYAMGNTVTVKLKDSTGNPISGGMVEYYYGTWKPFGTTGADGSASLALLPGTYSFRMTGTGTFGQGMQSQDIRTNPNVVFQTVNGAFQFKDSAGNPIDGAVALSAYWGGPKVSIGNTTGGLIDKQLLNTTLIVLTYLDQEIMFNVGSITGRPPLVITLSDSARPVTTATPAGGTYSTAKSVTLTCNDGSGAGCDKTYYTTDGSTPTMSSPVYTSPISISANYTTLKFFSRDNYGYKELVKTEFYTIGTSDTTPPVTTATPAGGSYTTAQVATLTCSDGTGSGCDRIYYTTDGSTPTTASPVYASPLNIAATATLKYFAKDRAGNSEAVKTQMYIIDATPPTGTIGINSGAVGAKSVNVTLALTCNDAQGCAQMQFSNDNVTYSAAEMFSAAKAWTLTAGDGSKTVYVKYKDTAGNWSTVYSASIILDTAVPVTTASPAGGTYSSAQSVALTCGDGTGSGCDKIYYTTDGSTPNMSSPVYSTPMAIAATAAVKYFATDRAGNNETVKTQNYTIGGTPPTGTIKINSGAVATNSVNAALTLTCTDTDGCSQMQFSNDNVTYSTAETFNATKTWPLTAGDGAKTVYVKFRDSAGNWSTAYSAAIILDTAVPITTATPAGGTYTNQQTVSLTCSDGSGSGCDRIYYTTDGTTPTTASPGYTSPISINATTTLKYFAKDKAGNSETVRTQTYTIEGTSPAGIISINSGATATNNVNVTLALTCGYAQGCSQMQFSNDNVTYSAAETFKATKAWTLPSAAGTRTVYVKFRDTAGNWSTAYSDAVILDLTAPGTTAAPSGGTYVNPQTVTMTCNDGTGSGCDRIYYTTDGTTPTTSSSVYTSPIGIAATTTLKYFARDISGNSEVVKSQKYSISTTSLTGSIVINSGAVATNNVNVTLALSCNDPQGCSQMQFSNDNKSYSAAEAFTTEKAWTLASGNGLKKVYVKFMNTAGAWSAACSEAIILDTAVPATTATPPGGTYSSAQSVTLICNDGSGSGCDRIYYTTDGTTPTASSPVYTAPVNIAATMILKYFAKDRAGNSEAVKSQTYTIDATPPAGTISINSGADTTNSVNATLTLACNNPQGCSQMLFSNDNKTYSTAETFSGTKAWTLKSGDGARTVYVKFRDAAGNWSIAYSDAILLDKTAPATTASPAGGAYSTAQSVMLTCSDGKGSGCDRIYYTTDGTTPTASSPVYAAPIGITATATLKYFAKDKAGNSEVVKASDYTIDATPPAGTISINSGAAATNSVSATLTLTCNDPQGCSQMQFSNDNVAYSAAETFKATKTWTLATGNGSKTVYVKFMNAAGNWSTAYSDAILLDKTAPATTATPPAGSYSAAQSVTLTCNDGAGSGCDSIYYTTDGTTPTTSSPVYASPVNITTSTTLKYFARDKAGNSEKVKSGDYTIDPTPPVGTISINSGAEATNSVKVTLTLTCNDAPGCSQMQFSNDNVTYSAAQTFSATKTWTLTAGDGSKTVYAKFRDTTGNWSTAYSDTVILDTAVPVTTASPAGGTYTGAQAVTLTCTDGSGSGCDRIYYTTDGTTPTASSSVYSAPINITATTTLKYFAKDKSGNSEAVKTETYTINLDTTLPVTTASPAGGTYATAQSVSLTCSDGAGSGCDRIYYTTDGTTPTTSSPVYASPINIAATATLKYFAQDKSGNSEAVKTETYNINAPYVSVTVRLKDSTGNPISEGEVWYNSGGDWLYFGTTDANGITSLSLTPGDYTFIMISGTYGSVDKSQNTASDPNVLFQTVRADITFKNRSGGPADGPVRCYSNGYFVETQLGNTAAGKIIRELLPNTYIIYINYLGYDWGWGDYIGEEPKVFQIQGGG